MRRPDLVVDTYHHIVLKSANDVAFLKEEEEWYRIPQLLFYQNDANLVRNWKRDIKYSKCKMFERPQSWPPHEPLVKIMAFAVHNNHIHLLVKEIREGGITAFMRKLPNGISNWLVDRQEKKGNIFQPYLSRLVTEDDDLRNLAMYIMVKNVFERYPYGGLAAAYENFERVFEWALSDFFSSFPDFAGNRNSPVIDKDILSTFFPNSQDFKEEAKKYIKHRAEKEEMLIGLTLE